MAQIEQILENISKELKELKELKESLEFHGQLLKKLLGKSTTPVVNKTKTDDKVKITLAAAKITLAAAKMAAEHGIDVSTLPGTGKNGRRVVKDVKQAIENKPEEPLVVEEPEPEVEKPEPEVEEPKPEVEEPEPEKDNEIELEENPTDDEEEPELE